MTDRRAFRALVDAKDILVLPGVFNGYSVRLVERYGYNMGFGLIVRGTTPLVTPKRLQALGVATVSYARMLTSAALRGMINALEAFAPTVAADEPSQRPDLLVPFDELNELMGLKQLEALEAKWTAE